MKGQGGSETRSVSPALPQLHDFMASMTLDNILMHRGPDPEDRFRTLEPEPAERQNQDLRIPFVSFPLFLPPLPAVS